jgi:hypothetical protein
MIPAGVLAPVAGLMMVTARITDPAMTPTVFNNWYSNVHVRDMINNKFSSIALRYVNYTAANTQPPVFTMASNYLALYDVPDIAFTSSAANMAKLPLNSDTFPDKTNPVMNWSQWNFTYWLPTQSFEGNSNATARSKYVIVAKVEPAAGGDDELDQFYRKQVLRLMTPPDVVSLTR